MKRLSWWKWLAESFGLEEIFWNSCRFGEQDAKLTILLSNVPGLHTSALRCCCCLRRHPMRLKGSRTSLAAAYPWDFCRAAARVFAEVLPLVRGRRDVASAPIPPGGTSAVALTHGPSDTPSFRRRCRTPLWTIHLCESLEWKTLIQYLFSEPGHINLQERRSLITFLKMSSKRSTVSGAPGQ